MNKKFNNWLDTFLSEKGIDLDQPINVEGESGLNFMTVENIVEFMKVTSAGEQKAIKNTFVMIDYYRHQNQRKCQHQIQEFSAPMYRLLK